MNSVHGSSAGRPVDEDSLMGDRIDRLLADLTLAEKVALMGGRDLWSVQPVDRLGIPLSLIHI